MTETNLRDLIKCLDTDPEKGIWENKQKTTNGFAKHEKVCFFRLIKLYLKLSSDYNVFLVQPTNQPTNKQGNKQTCFKKQHNTSMFGLSYCRKTKAFLSLCSVVVF